MCGSDEQSEYNREKGRGEKKKINEMIMFRVVCRGQTPHTFDEELVLEDSPLFFVRRMLRT